MVLFSLLLKKCLDTNKKILVYICIVELRKNIIYQIEYQQTFSSILRILWNDVKLKINMKDLLYFFCTLIVSFLTEKSHGSAVPSASSIYDFTVKDINGDSVKLSKYQGSVTFIVNVARKWGLTGPNYKELGILYDRYSKDGLKILAFPSNQFNQEPGTNEDTKKFNEMKKIKFDLFSRVKLNGADTHPLYKYLKSRHLNRYNKSSDRIRWNYTKFLVNRNGIPVKRYEPSVNPLKAEKDIVALLEEKSY